MDQEISTLTEQLIALILSAAVVGAFIGMLYFGTQIMDGSYAKIDNETTAIRDDSFEATYRKYIVDTEEYTVPSIAKEFNSLDGTKEYRIYIKDPGTGADTLSRTLNDTTIKEYYHKRAILKSTTNMVNGIVIVELRVVD